MNFDMVGSKLVNKLVTHAENSKTQLWAMPSKRNERIFMIKGLRWSWKKREVRTDTETITTVDAKGKAKDVQKGIYRDFYQVYFE